VQTTIVKTSLPEALSLTNNGAFTQHLHCVAREMPYLEGTDDMKAAHVRLAPAPDEDTLVDTMAERRREPRVAAHYQATLQFTQDDSADVQLADISMHGCCVKTEADGLRVGRFVSIGIDDEPMLQAVIRWVRAGSAGMEFLRPIPSERYEWHDLIDMPF
jgi:hypothetical protein